MTSFFLSLRVLRAKSLLVAQAIWCTTFVIVIALLLYGALPAVPYGVYAQAGAHWLSREPLYDLTTIDGFQYLPQSAALLSLFARLGIAGAILWRGISWALYAWGVWRIAKHLSPNRTPEYFLVATCLAVGPAVGSLGNGQANLAIAAITLHVVADIIEERWWRTTFLLAFGLSLKPIMAVMLLLVWPLYPALRWRTPVAVAIAFAFPFLVADPTYVIAQYSDCLIKLRMCAQPDRLFEDIRGLLATVGWLMPHSVYLIVRLLAALGAFALAIRARVRLREPFASFMIGALATTYLMLFNPRNQSTSYVMIGSFAALLTAAHAFCGRRRETLSMIAIMLVWTVASRHVFHAFENWMKPLATIAFAMLLVQEPLSVL